MSQMGTDDSMSDDVFEDDTLRAPVQRNAPSPTGYRDYQPPTETAARLQHDDDMPLHKTILLGDSGVGKTSLLVQFETGKFQSGNFSATVGIGFTPEEHIPTLLFPVLGSLNGVIDLQQKRLNLNDDIKACLPAL